jgi:hypothetical protein
MQQTELRALQSQIDAETRRIVLAASNELAQARSVVASLESEAARAGSGVFSDNDAQVHLRELMREAAAKTAIYEAFLVRARQVTERQRLDTTDIRVISPPIEPRSRSWPPPTLLLCIFCALAGMVLGVVGVLGAGIAAEMRSHPSSGPPIRQDERAVHRPVPVSRPRQATGRTSHPGFSTYPVRPRSLLDTWYGSGGAQQGRHDWQSRPGAVPRRS